MNYIYWLSQIKYSEQSLVGDRVFILNQLLQHDRPILSGFVLGANLWRELKSSLQGKLPELFQANSHGDIDNHLRLQSLAERSYRVIANSTFPQNWQNEIFRAATQLNSEHLILQPFIISPNGRHRQIDGMWRPHTCKTTPEAIATAIQLTWSELVTATSLLYWQQSGYSLDSVELAILIRPWKTAHASGIIELRDLISIRATWGGELSLFQGDVQTDEYYLDRDTGDIESQSLGHKNYAYRPRTDSAMPSVDCWEAYIPDESLASIYVLDDRAIASLFQLTQSIIAQQPQLKYLAWTAFKEDTALRFYITNCDCYLNTTRAIEIDEIAIASPPLLTGVAVSPGRVRGRVITLDNINLNAHTIQANSILVTKAIEPRHIPLLKQVSGIITEIGGNTSHGAIIARELKIPAIVNVANATATIRDGREILLDGDRGMVYPPISHRQSISLPDSSSSHFNYPIGTKLMVNLSQLESITQAVRLPIDGIGLLRSELMLAEFLSSQGLAQWQDSFKRQFVATLTDSLRQFAVAFAPRPVFYRSLDRPIQSSETTLSNRGIQGYMSDPSLFDLELEAIHTIISEGYGNLNLILPFVRSVDEFQFCYRRIEHRGLTACGTFQVWIMTEVPSAILLLPEYIRAGVLGIAIGTNDLTQLLLGVDREQSQFGDRGLNANHPAVQQAIAELIKTAHDGDIECCICGQAPVEHPSLIDKLIDWGIDVISVEPEAVSRTYKAIARAERRMLLKKARSSE